MKNIRKFTISILLSLLFLALIFLLNVDSEIKIDSGNLFLGTEQRNEKELIGWLNKKDNASAINFLDEMSWYGPHAKTDPKNNRVILYYQAISGFTPSYIPEGRMKIIELSVNVKVKKDLSLIYFSEPKILKNVYIDNRLGSSRKNIIKKIESLVKKDLNNYSIDIPLGKTTFFDSKITGHKIKKDGIYFTESKKISFEKTFKTTKNALLKNKELSLVILVIAFLGYLTFGYRRKIFKQKYKRLNDIVNEFLERPDMFDDKEKFQEYILKVNTYNNAKNEWILFPSYRKYLSDKNAELVDSIFDSFRSYREDTDSEIMPDKLIAYLLANEINIYYVGLNYITGIKSTGLSPNTKIALLLDGNSFIVYSYMHNKVVCRLSTYTVTLKEGKSFRDYLAADLAGYDEITKENINIKIKLDFSASVAESGYINYDSTSAYISLNSLLHWLYGLVADSQSDTNAVDHAKKAGNKGEAMVQGELDSLVGDDIFGYVSSENMVIDNRNFEIDFLVLSKKYGYVLLEVKYYAGTIAVDASGQWEQTREGVTSKCKNAAVQVVRTKELFEKVVQQEGMPDLPVTPLVVFTHPTAKITQVISHQSPQCEVIILSMLKGWLKSEGENNFSFENNDLKFIEDSLKKYEKEFIPK